MPKYIIPKNFHYCTALCKRFEKIDTTNNIFEFELTPNHWYDFKEVRVSGKNKIIGRTYGFGVHNNSIRIVYKPDKQKNMFHVWWYWYDAGKRKHKYIGKFGVGRYTFTTEMLDLKNVSCDLFKSDSLIGCIIIEFSEELKTVGYYCFPYFGGKARAPWNITWYVYYDEQLK